MLSALAALALAVALPAQPAPLPKGAQLSRSAPTAEVSLTFGYELRDAATLDALIARQQDPASALFRRWLTPAEFGAHFGQPAEGYDAAARALTAAGFKVDRYPDRILLRAHGTVAQAEKLLGVQLFDVQVDEDGFRTFRGAPQL